MEVPVDILVELKCSSCETYLSRGPVYLQHDGAAVCGQCYTPKRPATRNTQYEAMAKLFKYSCKNWELGCPEIVVQEAAMIAHEEVCEHRKYMCPVLGSARCDWLGPRAAMLAHCRDQHPDSVLENPCSLTHDITNASLHNYIISAFHVLFLLHTKVCVTTGKIFHAVRLLGDLVETSNFFFNLDIKRANELLSKKGQVAPEGCLAIQEDTSLAVNINSILDVLGGFDDTKFTVTVEQRVSYAADQLMRTMEKCSNCKAEVRVFQYRDNNGWRCKRCVPARRACKEQPLGCAHIDIKWRKHQLFYCQQSTKCYICKVDISRGSLSAHYGSAHQDITHRAGSTWWVTVNCFQNKYCLVSYVEGTAVCEYSLTRLKYVPFPEQFTFNVYTSILNERLREFRCSVRVTNPATGHSCTFTPDTVYNEWYDWRIIIKEDECSWWNVVFDICVNITKI